jgi:thiol-disulfide isomerase/thioredoxin
MRLCWFLLAAFALIAPPLAAAEPPHALGLPVGALMEDFGLRALDPVSGELKSLVWLSDFVGGSPNKKEPAQLLLLNFFATWCGPCMEELPELTRLQEQYKTYGLKIVSVNFRAEGETPEEAIAATRKLFGANNAGFPLLFDRFTNRNQLIYLGEKASLPCNLLIDAEGKILERFQGGNASALAGLEARIRQVLQVPEPSPAKPLARGKVGRK